MRFGGKSIKYRRLFSAGTFESDTIVCLDGSGKTLTLRNHKLLLQIYNLLVFVRDNSHSLKGEAIK